MCQALLDIEKVKPKPIPILLRLQSRRGTGITQILMDDCDVQW